MQKLLTLTDCSDSLNVKKSYPVLCYYKNPTREMQIVQIYNEQNLELKRVVFPGEQLLFEALPESELEVSTNTPVGAIFIDKLLCSDLQVHR
ncbi:MAG TPA: DUF1830 domain-containing protein [Coleofasciculaceae cyanobacterium]